MTNNLTNVKTPDNINPTSATSPKPDLIFLGQGPLADYALETLKNHFNIIFHAKTRADLDTVKNLKERNKDLPAILASFGVIIKKDFLDLFEPTGILNIHPSLLPKYRGPSPIETAIRNGDTEFGVSVMKLVPDMDAGPLYFQTTLDFPHSTPKIEIYQALAKIATEWLNDNLAHLNDNTPTPQTGTPTYTEKLTTALSPLDPVNNSALDLHNQVRAYQKFPKSRYTFFDTDCIILETHISKTPESPLNAKTSESPLSLKCSDGKYLIIDRLQPAGKKPMDVKAFLNGYSHKR